MTTLKLLCSASYRLMLLAGLAYAGFASLPMTRQVETGDRRP